ncbi:MAG TPA: hypothetical protein VK602_14980 [Phyllobacterium sp.]|jgi:hypothetical protein|nr:hypothetical protein [Phyllobacterium sp.]
MMGRLKSDQGQLFYEFRLGDAVPEDYLVRKIDTCPRSRMSNQMSCFSRRAKQKDRPKAVSIGKRAGYILS